jgi:nucleoside phosphorylase
MSRIHGHSGVIFDVASTSQMLRTLLGETPYRVLELLSKSDTPVSGRYVARTLGVSPTTATSALAKLKDSEFALSETAGRAQAWELNANSMVIQSWLQEIHGVVVPLSGRPELRAVVLTALQEEYAAVVAHLDDRQSDRVGSTRYERGRFTGTNVDWTVYVAEIGMGNVAAAAELSAANTQLKPNVVLFVGVAGSVKPDDLCRGDVIVGSHAYNIHAGKDAVDDAERPVSLARPLSSQASYGLVQLATAVRQKQWTGELLLVGAGEVKNALGQSPRVEIKGIAAGEVVHADSKSALMEKIRTTFNDVAAVDMESYGLYETAHRLDVPALAVRGISDSVGDKNPGDDANWQPTASRHAAGFMFAMLRAAELEDLGAKSAPPRPSPGAPGADGSSIDDALYRLPPAIAVAYDWAHRQVGDRVHALVNEIAEQNEQWAPWLDRFRQHTPTDYSTADSGPLWVVVATYADAHHHGASGWLYAEAAERIDDVGIRSYLYGRAALAESRDGRQSAADDFMSKAESLSPAAQRVWDLHRVAVANDAEAMLAAVAPLVEPLDLVFIGSELPDSSSTNTGDDQLVTFLDHFAFSSPELFEQLRFFVALCAAVALQATGQLLAAQLLLEAMTGGLPSERPSSPGNAVRGSLVGPRTATVITQLAKTLCMRVVAPGNKEPGFDVDRTLATAAELALTGRDRILDWFGPTDEALQVAAMARSRAGDPRGALSLLLAAPDGTARPEEASQQSVIATAAEFAAGTGQIDLAFKLAAKITDPIERHIATGLAFMLRENCRAEATDEFRLALGDPAVLDRPDQQIRALLALSMVAELTEQELSLIDGFDRQTADLIRAQAHVTAGRGAEAQVLARRYASSEAAVQIRAQVLLNQGDTLEAVQLLEAHAEQHSDERFLMQAGTLALSADLNDEAERLARLLAGSLDPNRRRIAGEVLVDTASRSKRWDRVLAETARLTDDGDIASSDPDRTEHLITYRWARVQAHYQLRQIAEAYAVLRDEPSLVPSNTDQARLVLSILHFLAPTVIEAGSVDDDEKSTVTQAEILARVSSIAKAFSDDEEIVATALMTSLSLRPEEPLDPAQLAQARGLQEQFFQRFPDSQIVRQIPIDDTLSTITETLRTQLAPGAELGAQMRRAAWSGRIPLSFYATSLRKSYADALVRDALESYIILNPDPQIAPIEVAAAADALNGAVVVDASALFLADTAFGDLRELRSRFERLLLPAPQRDDILAARGPLHMASPFSMSWDPINNRPTLVEHDEATNTRWANEADRLVSALEHCEVIPDAPDENQDERLWSSPIRLAKQRGIPLLADDAALRAVARTEGVAAFSSVHVLHALVGTGEFDPSVIRDAYRRLMTIHAADLPVLDELLQIAAEDSWKPNSYAAFLLARPAIWHPLDQGLTAYMDVIKAATELETSDVALWCSTALFGLCQAIVPPMLPVAASTIASWTVLHRRDPEVLPAVLKTCHRVLVQFDPNIDLLREVVLRIISTLRQVIPPEHLSGYVIPLLQGLDEAQRSKALEIFLTAP